MRESGPKSEAMNQNTSNVRRCAPDGVRFTEMTQTSAAGANHQKAPLAPPMLYATTARRSSHSAPTARRVLAPGLLIGL